MKLPQHLTGPQFPSGDIVSFTFNDCVLSLRLPIIPNNTDKIDSVSQQRYFDWADTADWEHFGDDGKAFICLADQEWRYECEITHDDIASCYMSINVIKHSNWEIENFIGLNTQVFKNYHLAVLAKELKRFESSEIPSQQPSASNNYLVETVEKPLLNGFRIQLKLSDATPVPSLAAFLSLGRHFTLKIDWRFGSVLYRDRENPYSEELLHQMKFELFDEFLSLINIDYTPEILELIEALKSS